MVTFFWRSKRKLLAAGQPPASPTQKSQPSKQPNSRPSNRPKPHQTTQAFKIQPFKLFAHANHAQVAINSIAISIHQGSLDTPLHQRLKHFSHVEQTNQSFLK
ncbi:hypothetical protein Pnap_0072 [Polaromonas naphthalenivorans CJ2]|uniref:Uncharacterized protein n=1 Tax=Polaromonas naphthalenivorans (strain CJ2) TaxID=365044 RepID=A1VIC0_POLNA|nr:hypothetical protein Pnap_0072 [Polaromonas naphthalenivorans CJ2]